MSSIADTDRNLALFCDFENVALGVQDAKFPKFDMGLVLERLLLKGNIVVKKAYCDWDRYKGFKPNMHEAAFELIEIPHTRQSGKNSADIRMVVDALDLCYTKDHIDTFVIISGDSDFSPLVSKLRENAKLVIGVGVRNSTSDLLMNNCDEFLFYDDLVQAISRSRSNRKQSGQTKASTRTPAKKTPSKKAKASAAAKSGSPAVTETAVTEEVAGAGKALSAEEAPSTEEALDLVLETAEALISERGDRVFGSMVKQTLKRRRPGFSESAYGFRSFGDLLEHAAERGLADIEMDERSGGYVIRSVHR